VASPALFVWVGRSALKLRQAVQAELSAEATDAPARARDAVNPSTEQIVAALDDVRNVAPMDFVGPGNDALSIWMCAVLDEEELHHLLGAQLERIVEALEKRDLIPRAQVSTLLIVPPGKHEKNSDLAKSLDRLETETRCQHFCWVVSAGKYALTEHQRHQTAAKFLVLWLTTDLHLWLWAHGRFDHIQTRVGTVGLSGALIPASELIRSVAVGKAIDVLTKEFLQPELQTPFEEIARTFFERNDLSAENLASQIGGSRLSTNYDFDFSALENLSPEDLPDRIWSIYFFHALGGMTSDLHAISERARQLLIDSEIALKNQVSQIVQSSIRPQAALHFLSTLEKLLRNERARQEMPHTSLHSAVAAYTAAHESLPSGSWSVALFALWPAFLISYLLHPYVPLLVSLPELPNWALYLVTLSICGIVFGCVGGLNNVARIGRFRTARQRTISALKESLNSARETRLYRESTSILGKLMVRVTVPSVLQAQAIEFDAQENEVEALTRYHSVLMESLAKLKSTEETNSGFSPLFAPLDGRITEDGRLSTSELATQLVQHGIHRDWRTATSAPFCDRLVALASNGLSVSPNAAEILSKMDPQKARLVANSMLERSEALVVHPRGAAEQAMDLRFLFVPDGTWAQDRSPLNLQNIEKVIMSTDKYGVYLLRAFLGVPHEAILGNEAELGVDGE
jgi:hypothetical protein